MSDELAFGRAATLYADGRVGLEQDILEYAKSGGYSYISPTCLILAAFWQEDPLSQATWYVHLAVGRGAMDKFFQMAPQPANFVALARPGRGRADLTFYPYERMRRLCTRCTSIR